MSRKSVIARKAAATTTTTTVASAAIESILRQGADPLALLATEEQREAWASRRSEAAAAEAAEKAEAAKKAEAVKKAEEKAEAKKLGEILRLRGRIHLHKQAAQIWGAFEAGEAAVKRRMLAQYGAESLRAASLAKEMLQQDQRRLALLEQ